MRNYGAIHKIFLNKLYVTKKVIPIVPKSEFFIVLPYLGNDVIQFKAESCFKNLSPQCNIRIILKSTNRLSSLFRFKDVIPKDLQSRMVCAILTYDLLST